MIKSAIQQKSIGNLLRQKRKERTLTIEEIAETIKIRIEYLTALENGNYEIFPSDVYAKGFLKNYAKFLGIKPEHALALYRRDNRGVKKTQPKTENVFSTFISKIVITPNRILIALGIVAVILILFYLSSYINRVLKKPDLSITAPISITTEGDYEYKTDQTSINIAGKVDSAGTKVTVNGEDVAPSTVSEFSKDYQLTESSTKFTIKAISAFGRETKIIINVIRNESTDLNNLSATNISGFVTVRENNTKITISVDGVPKLEKVYAKNTSLDFLALSQVSVLSNKNNSFSITINGVKEDVQGNLVEYSIIDGQILKK